MDASSRERSAYRNDKQGLLGKCTQNATQLFRTGKVETVLYDLSAEDGFGCGRGAECNGIVTVLVRDIGDGFRHIPEIVHKQLQANKPTYFLQSLTDYNQ